MRVQLHVVAALMDGADHFAQCLLAMAATLDPPDAVGTQPTDPLGGAACPAVGADGQVTRTLGARGYYWLAVGEAGRTP